MDFVSLLTPLLALAILVERVLEMVWNIVEVQKWTQATIARDPERYALFKQILSVVVGVVIGAFVANLLNIAMFSTLTDRITIDPAIDRFVTGAAAGAVAPYAHQIFQALLNFQKLLEQQKKNIENPTRTE